VNVGTNAAGRVTTNEVDDYSFPPLPLGTYTVKVEKTGFKTGVYCLPTVSKFDNGRRPR